MEIPTPAELREKRIRMGLKQADVARMAGISQSMVARIEAGSVDPRVMYACKDCGGPAGGGTLGDHSERGDERTRILRCP